MPMKMVVSAFPEGGVIPRLHTGEGADVSPAIEWSGAPEGTSSYALVVDDPDAPAGVWTHWLLWDIPRGVTALAQAFKPGRFGQSGANDFGRTGYGGPMPPKGHGPHRYFFKLYAVDVPALPLHPGARRAEFDRAIKGHVLAEATYMGCYERR